MRKIAIRGISGGLLLSYVVVEAGHIIANPMDVTRDQVQLAVTSTSDTGTYLPISDTVVEGREYPRPQPERPRATERSTGVTDTG
jgi:hypothetical protein